jgi:hypothetical protein
MHHVRGPVRHQTQPAGVGGGLKRKKVQGSQLVVAGSRVFGLGLTDQYLWIDFRIGFQISITLSFNFEL